MGVGGLPVTLVSEHGLPVTPIDDQGRVIFPVSPALPTASLQAEIDRAEADGGGVIYLAAGEGTHTALTLPDTVHLVGAGMGRTILNVNASVTGAFITVDEFASDWSVRDMTIDYQSNVNGRNQIKGDNPRGGRVERVQFLGTKTRQSCFFTFNTVNANNGNLKLLENEVVDGDSSGLVLITGSDLYPAYNIEVSHNRIHSGGSMLQIAAGDPYSDPEFGAFVGTRIIGNTFVDNGTGVSGGGIPTELWGHDDLIVAHNVIHGGTRGIGTAMVRAGTIFGNVINNQSAYAFEISTPDGLEIFGNTARRCRMMASINAATGQSSRNLHFHDNIIDGSAQASYQSSADCIQFVSTSHQGIVIENNTFLDIEHLRAIIRVDAPSAAVCRDIVIRGNVYEANTEYCPITFVNIRRGTNVVVRDNVVRYRANYTVNTPGYDNRPGFIITTLGGDVDGAEILENDILFSGTAAGGGVRGISTGYGAAGTHAKFTARRNRFVGTFAAPLYIDITSGDSIVEGNDVSQATGTSTFNAALVKRRTRNEYEASAMPTSGSFTAGDWVWNTAGTISGGKVLIGWYRLTTGSAHVSGTDWTPMYATTT